MGSDAFITRSGRDYYRVLPASDDEGNYPREMNYVLGGRTIGAVLARSQGAAFSPLSLSPVLWLDASQLTGLSDGAAIATWTDASVNGRNAMQGTAGVQPIYKTAILNGKPVARFDGGDWLDVATVTALGIADLTTGHTIIAVYKTAASSGNPFVGSNFNSAAGTNVIGFAATQITNLRGGSVSTHLATATQDTNWHIGTHWYSGGGPVKTFNGWRDKVSLTLNPSNGTFGDTSTFESTQAWRLGRWGDLAIYFSGDIAEIIMFATALSTANRQAVEAYLSAKYSIALA